VLAVALVLRAEARVQTSAIADDRPL